MDDAGNGCPFIRLAEPEIVKRGAGTPLLLAELASLFDPDARPGQILIARELEVGNQDLSQAGILIQVADRRMGRAF
jgi:hypothetical protein